MKKTIAILSVFALALSLSASPALAFGSSDIVINDNGAIVMNHVSSNSNTGINGAGGSTGGDGGDGGRIRNSGDDVEGSTTGNGGTGGDGSTGGTVVTGNATSRTGVANVVNTNDTEIDRCCGEDSEEPVEVTQEECCGGEGDGSDFIMNRNRALVMNGAGSNANTGINGAAGSEGGDAGAGGEINNGSYQQEEGDGDVQESGTGTGGNGGNGGLGGYIETGAADSTSEVVNVVNRNITRIRR